MIPEPFPRFCERIKTVARRSCSPISLNPIAAMSSAPVRTFPNNDRGLPNRPAPHQLCRHRLANRFSLQLRLDVFEPRHGAPGKRHKNVADHDASVVCGSVRLHFQDNRGGSFLPLKRLTERFRETDRLQTDTQVAQGNTALFEKRSNHRGDGRRGNGCRSKARESRGSEPHSTSIGVNSYATDRCRLESNIETDIRRERYTRPRTALSGNKAHDTERGDRTTCASAANHKRETPRVYDFTFCGVVRRQLRFLALQNGEVRSRIAPRECCRGDTAIGQSYFNFFVATERVLGGNNQSRLPHYSTRRASSLRVNGNDALRNALGYLCEGIGKFNEFYGHVPASLNKMPETGTCLHPPNGQVAQRGLLLCVVSQVDRPPFPKSSNVTFVGSRVRSRTNSWKRFPSTWRKVRTILDPFSSSTVKYLFQALHWSAETLSQRILFTTAAAADLRTQGQTSALPSF